MHETQRSLTRGLVPTKILLLSSFDIPSLCSLPSTASFTSGLYSDIITVFATIAAAAETVLAPTSTNSIYPSVRKSESTNKSSSYLTKIISLSPVAAEEEEKKEGNDHENDVIFAPTSQEQRGENDTSSNNNRTRCNTGSLIFSR